MEKSASITYMQRRFDWKIADPREMPPERFREIRDLIEAKVKELLQTL